MSSILPDKPATVDEFERLELVDIIAKQIIVSPFEESFVYGLEAEWGEGKSTLIKFIEDSLTKHKNFNPIIIHFNPWSIQGVDSLIREFLKVLIDNIKKRSNSEFKKGNTEQVARLLDNISNFGDLLTPLTLIPQAAPFMLATKGFLGAIKKSRDAVKKLQEVKDLSPLSYKEKIDHSLKEIGQPIVVFIDDIDRLPPNEVRIIFQMVKAVCNFNGVSYFLSYDPIPVAEALSFNETYNGRKYIEKIVQQVYHVPRADYLSLKIFLQKKIDALLQTYDHSLSEHEKELEERAFIHVTRILKTPRDVIRLTNKLSLYLASLKAEINFFDVLCYISIELKYPKLSKYLKSDPSYVFGSNEFDEESDYGEWANELLREDNEQNKTKEINYLLVLFNETETPHDKYLAEALYSLFPNIKRGITVKSNYDEMNAKRLRVKENWFKFLSIGVPSLLMTDAKFQILMTSSEDRKAILNEWAESGNLRYFIEQLLIILENKHSVYNLVNLTEDINSVLSSLDDELLERYLKRIVSLKQQDPEQAIYLSAISINAPTSITTAETVLSSYLLDLGILGREKDTLVLKDDHKDFELYTPLIETLINRIENSLENIFEERSPISIFYRWGQLSGTYKNVQAFILSLKGEQLKKCVTELWENSYNSIPNIADNLIGNIESFLEVIKIEQLDTEFKGFINLLKQYQNSKIQNQSFPEELK